MSLLRRERILLVPEGQNNDFTPCGWIRLIHPWFAFAEANDHEIHVGTWSNIEAFKPSVVVTQRTVAGENAPLLISKAKTLGITTVLDLDDYLLELPKNHPDCAEYDANRPNLQAALAEVDFITVSTESLAAKLNFPQKTILIPNALAPQIWSDSGDVQSSVERGSKYLNVLYAGTTSHRSDWAMIEDQVFHALKTNKSLRIFLVGVTSEKLPKHKNLIRLKPTRAAIASYPAYVSWLRQRQKFDFGIAPLINNEFNSYKSDLKLLEYSALGARTLCSPVEPYLKTKVEHQFFNFVPDSDWFEVLSKLELKETRSRVLSKIDPNSNKIFLSVEGANQLGIASIF